jgi:hypothetical protein
MFRTILIFISISLLISCGMKEDFVGDSTKTLDGNESNLPTEIKGLRVYSVKTKNGWVNVGIKDNVTSLNYDVQYGKTLRNETVILINKDNNKLIQVKEILMENDSMIVCKK